MPKSLTLRAFPFSEIQKVGYAANGKRFRSTCALRAAGDYKTILTTFIQMNSLEAFLTFWSRLLGASENSSKEDGAHRKKYRNERWRRLHWTQTNADAVDFGSWVLLGWKPHPRRGEVMVSVPSTAPKLHRMHPAHSRTDFAAYFVEGRRRRSKCI
jgi:hypothetical protein